jgi:hypothetical protein
MKSPKIFQLLLVIILIVFTALIANPARAQISAPSVPEFTLQYVDRSYNIPPTYGTDPYTGETIITSPAVHVDNRTIDVTIQNQPFTPYQDGNHTIQLYYNVRSKGHFAEFTSDSDYGSHSATGVQASTSSDTVISFSIEYWNIPLGGQIDFEVQAFIGYTYYNEGACFTDNVVTVGESAWSSPQTISFGSGAVSTSAPSTPTPTATSPPTATASPFRNLTAIPIQPDPQKSVLFGGIDWQQIALIAMAAMIAVLLGILAAVIGWRKAAAK